MNSKKLFSIMLVFVVLVLPLCGCSKKIDDKVEGITLSQTQIEIAEGGSHTIYAEVVPLSAENKNVKWTSTNEDIATVSHGTIKAKDTGSCKVYATSMSGDITEVCDVVVCDNFLRVSGKYEESDAGYGTQIFGSISEALAVACEDSVVIVEAGEYDEYVNITKSATIKGQNAVITGGFAIGYPKLDEKAKEINIDGFTFKVGNNTPLDQYAGIYIGNKADEVEITNCNFIGEYKDGDKIAWNEKGIDIGIYSIPSDAREGAKDISIQSCKFENLHYGVMFMPYVSETDIENCDFGNCGFGMRFAGSHKMEVENNSLSNSGFIQFGYAENLADMIEVENNVIENYPNGNLVEALEGSVDKGFKLDLSKNTFVGLSGGEMTREEFEILAGKIQGIEKDGKIINMKIASSKEMKEIYKEEKVD